MVASSKRLKVFRWVIDCSHFLTKGVKDCNLSFLKSIELTGSIWSLEMDLVCDANVWYDFVRNGTDPRDIKNAGHRLLVGPLTYLEIVSKMDSQNFEQRRDVCKIIATHCNEILPGPDSHLAKLWGFTPPSEPIDWWQALESVASATSLDDLSTGVKSNDGTFLGRTDVAKALRWREAVTTTFLHNIETTIDKFCRGYHAARLAKRAICVDQATGDLFRNAVRTSVVQRGLVKATFDRVRSVLKDNCLPDPYENEVDEVLPLLHPYISVYCEFLHDVATRKPPSPNDLCDLENFYYLQENRILWTSDARWLSHATTAGVAHLLHSASASSTVAPREI